MWVKTIDGNTRTFLFESSNEEHEQFMEPTATGFRGKAYTIGDEPVELPDPVGGYAVANVDLAEQVFPVAAETCATIKTNGAVCGRELPCQYHPADEGTVAKLWRYATKSDKEA